MTFECYILILANVSEINALTNTTRQDKYGMKSYWNRTRIWNWFIRTMSVDATETIPGKFIVSQHCHQLTKTQSGPTSTGRFYVVIASHCAARNILYILIHCPMRYVDIALKSYLSNSSCEFILSCATGFRWMPQNLVDEESILVHVVTWYRQATDPLYGPMLTQIYITIWRQPPTMN